MDRHIVGHTVEPGGPDQCPTVIPSASDGLEVLLGGDVVLVLKGA